MLSTNEIKIHLLKQYITESNKSIVKVHLSFDLDIVLPNHPDYIGELLLFYYTDTGRDELTYEFTSNTGDVIYRGNLQAVLASTYEWAQSRLRIRGMIS